MEVTDYQIVICPVCYHAYRYNLDTHEPDDCPNCGYSIYMTEVPEWKISHSA